MEESSRHNVGYNREGWPETDVTGAEDRWAGCRLRKSCEDQMQLTRRMLIVWMWIFVPGDRLDSLGSSRVSRGKAVNL